MEKGKKREQLSQLIKNSIDLYLTQNLDEFGFSHVIDVNMQDDLKTAHVYIEVPVEKNKLKLLNKISGENHKIVEIFKQNFTSKFLPRLKYIFIDPDELPNV